MKVVVENLEKAKISGVICCREMMKAMDDDFIKFGEYDHFLNEDSNMNIFHCNPYPEDPIFDEMPIKFCPFCGEKIEVIILENGTSRN